MNIDKKIDIKKIFLLAVKNHKEHKFDNAQNLYKKILEKKPNTFFNMYQFWVQKIL